MNKTMKYRGTEVVCVFEQDFYKDVNDTVTGHKMTVSDGENYTIEYEISLNADLKTEALQIEETTKQYIDSQLNDNMTPQEEILHLIGFFK